jgi:hypothetical protein
MPLTVRQALPNRATRYAGLLLAGTLLAGCSSLATAPAGKVEQLAGHWVLDPARSDDFDALLDKYLGEHRRKLRERTRMIEGQEMRGGRDVAPLGFSPEDPARERQRMAEELQLPASLVLAILPGEVAISAAGEPERRFVPGERVTRIDVSGTARVECGWESQAFVVAASYVHRAERSWRYELDHASGELRLSFAGTDPEYGPIKLQAHYRRAP